MDVTTSGTPGHAALATASAFKAWFGRRGADQHALWIHLRRRWYVYLPFAFLLLAAQHYLLFNVTQSLPYSVVWLDRESAPARGDLVVYRFEGEELMQIRKGQRFFKRIVGLPGDEVSVDGRRVLVNGTDVGIAKQYTLDGHRLEPVAAGVIPHGYYFVQGTHAMSFDSRYRASGLVHSSQIIGTVHVIF
jgi:conjugal transfer pilin signal peptidase TrbI